MQCKIKKNALSLDGLLKRGHRYVRQELLSESQAKWKKRGLDRLSMNVCHRGSWEIRMVINCINSSFYLKP